MIAADTRVYRRGEFHSFSARNRHFLYLVPAGAIFELDGAAEMLLDRLTEGEASEEQLVADLAGRGFPAADAQELISELYQSRVIVSDNLPPEPPQDAPAAVIMRRMVRYGDTGHPNLHYCDWIRDWTDTCLQIYGAISAHNPEFLRVFAERKAIS